MPAPQVLDSYALLKLLRDEPGAEAVAQILEKAGLHDRITLSLNSLRVSMLGARRNVCKIQIFAKATPHWRSLCKKPR